MSAVPFSSLGLKTEIQENLETLGYLQPTPIQAQSLPTILSGKDLIAQAQTGSGKTAAFGLGLLNRLQVADFTTQALVLCPTRELADQVAREIRRLARSIANIKVLTLCGGSPVFRQAKSLARSPHVVVGTPGRVEDLLAKGHLRLQGLQTLVLDEADRMLDMGFQPSLDAIIKFTPSNRQTLLFSATYPEQIDAMARRVMVDAVKVEINREMSVATIDQHFYRLEGTQDRFTALLRLLLHFRPESALLFCNTKQMAQQTADELCQRGFSASALHGDLDQKKRDQTLERFANKSMSILVATDVAARGIDIDRLDLVINYDFARDSDIHLHRVGRTGRAGKGGTACTLVTAQEGNQLARLEQNLNLAIEIQPLPDSALLAEPAYLPERVTLQIEAGKKQKLRPGDILGALTAKQGIDASQVGRITIGDRISYVAVHRNAAEAAVEKLRSGKLKGRNFSTRKLGNH